MFRQFGKSWQALRQRPALAAAILLVLGAVAALIVVDSWASRNYQAAQSATRKEKYEEARAYLQQCQRVWWWQGAKTELLAARLERLLGNLDEARELLDECIRKQRGSDEKTNFEMLLLNAEAGSGPGSFFYGEAVLWDMVQKKHTELLQVLRTLAKVYLQQHRAGPALDALNRWLALKPDSAEALEWRGTAKEWQQEYAGAEKDFQQALVEAPQRHSARFCLVQLYLSKKANTKEIFEHLQILLQAEPDRVDYLLALTRGKMLEGEYQEARQTLDRVLTLNPKDGVAMQMYGEIEFQEGRYVAAETWTRKALNHGVLNQKVYFLLAKSLDAQQDSQKSEEAKKYYQKNAQITADLERLGKLLGGELEKGKHHPDLLAEMGEIMLRGNQEAVGMSWLKEALKKDATHKGAHTVLYEYYLEKNQPQKAAEHAKFAKTAVNK